ncbi:MAG: prepilin peptidase [Candidatus Omnitrophica bacterium]|nr:prepilin peptidase [Candidatus Omnitrophota bacterium]
MEEIILKIFIFVFGATIGSFLNVCIYRMPRKESIVKPPSHCPGCQHRINWYDNIPFLSFVFLRGRCRHCGQRISWRYFIVELISASIFLSLYLYFGISLRFWIFAAVSSSLIVASFIDIAIREIPDEISLWGIVIGLIVSVIFPQLHSSASRLTSLGLSFLGLLAGGGSIYITGIIGDAIFKKESMGGGDVKLMAMLGTFIGWKLVLLTFFLAPFFGAIFGIILKIKKGESFIPYGPFLSLAALISVFWGEKIIKWLFLI